MPRPTRPGAAHLILMSRAPVTGRTKTRLVPPLTPEQARDFHATCLGDLIEAAEEWRQARRAAGETLDCHLFITPPGSEAAFRAAGVRWSGHFRVHDQDGETLGERMAHAIATVRAGAGEGPPPRVVLVGSDLPLLGAAQWEAALASLERHDVVFGPTPDGGYYLVALRTDPAGLFSLSAWGGATVLEDSLRAAAARGLRAGRIDELPDADTAADLRAIRVHPLARALVQRRSLALIESWFGDGPAQPD